MEREGRETNLVVMVIIALATFLIPVVQRWLRHLAERGRAPVGEGADAAEPPDPYADLRSDEPEVREEESPRSRVEEPEPAKAPSEREKPPDVEPLLQPAGTPRRPGYLLEERLFAHRRWSPGAKLIIAKELLERPKCFRRAP